MPYDDNRYSKFVYTRLLAFFHFSNTLQQVGQTELFSFGMLTDLEEERL